MMRQRNPDDFVAFDEDGEETRFVRIDECADEDRCGNSRNSDDLHISMQMTPVSPAELLSDCSGSDDIICLGSDVSRSPTTSTEPELVGCVSAQSGTLLQLQNENCASVVDGSAEVESRANEGSRVASTGDEIKCYCDVNEDVHTMMIQCETCLYWQHIHCVGVRRKHVPENYNCWVCQPRALPLSAANANTKMVARLRKLKQRETEANRKAHEKKRPAKRSGHLPKKMSAKRAKPDDGLAGDLASKTTAVGALPEAVADPDGLIQKGSLNTAAEEVEEEKVTPGARTRKRACKTAAKTDVLVANVALEKFANEAKQRNMESATSDGDMLFGCTGPVIMKAHDRPKVPKAPRSKARRDVTIVSSSSKPDVTPKGQQTAAKESARKKGNRAAKPPRERDMETTSMRGRRATGRNISVNENQWDAASTTTPDGILPASAEGILPVCSSKTRVRFITSVASKDGSDSSKSSMLVTHELPSLRNAEDETRDLSKEASDPENRTITADGKQQSVVVGMDRTEEQTAKVGSGTAEELPRSVIRLAVPDRLVIEGTPKEPTPLLTVMNEQSQTDGIATSERVNDVSELLDWMLLSVTSESSATTGEVEVSLEKNGQLVAVIPTNVAKECVDEKWEEEAKEKYRRANEKEQETKEEENAKEDIRKEEANLKWGNEKQAERVREKGKEEAKNNEEATEIFWEEEKGGAAMEVARPAAAFQARGSPYVAPVNALGSFRIPKRNRPEDEQRNENRSFGGDARTRDFEHTRRPWHYGDGEPPAPYASDSRWYYGRRSDGFDSRRDRWPRFRERQYQPDQQRSSYRYSEGGNWWRAPANSSSAFTPPPQYQYPSYPEGPPPPAPFMQPYGCFVSPPRPPQPVPQPPPPPSFYGYASVQNVCPAVPPSAIIPSAFGVPRYPPQPYGSYAPFFQQPGSQYRHYSSFGGFHHHYEPMSAGAAGVPQPQLAPMVNCPSVTGRPTMPPMTGCPPTVVGRPTVPPRAVLSSVVPPHKAEVPTAIPSVAGAPTVISPKAVSSPSTPSGASAVPSDTSMVLASSSSAAESAATTPVEDRQIPLGQRLEILFGGGSKAQAISTASVVPEKTEVHEKKL